MAIQCSASTKIPPYDVSTRSALAAQALKSILVAERYTQTAQTRKAPGSNPGGDTKTPDTEMAYGLNLKFGGCGFESHAGDQHSPVTELAYVRR